LIGKFDALPLAWKSRPDTRCMGARQAAPPVVPVAVKTCDFNFSHHRNFIESK
jgi:hypothetical protein